MGKDNQLESVTSVLKVFGILEILSEQKDIGITELSKKLMMPKSTSYRFLQTMINSGYVKQEDDDKYSLTLKLFEIGARAIEYTDLIALSDKEMSYISKQTNETLHLGVLDKDEIIYLHKIDSTYNLRMHSRVGRRNPSYSTALGKILLSDYDNNVVRDILKDTVFITYTDNTLKSIDELLIELERVRNEHYAQDNEEQEPGLKCIAAPIYNRLGHIIAGISISLPMIRFEEKNFPNLINLLQNAGKNISEKLGYYNYPTP
ncbi:DNA-binding transcriptional regulator KdgR [Pasteurella testudinis]|uniref:DNA-binding transcriptional regulator KdgR n=1 Tax=Pasteurella testudinis TaxID=761 RepID=UPI004059D1DB